MENKNKILIVDDEIDYAQILMLKFQSLGYEAAAANDVRDIVNITKTFHPDVVVIDNRMPDVSGSELFEAFRSKDEFKTTPFIFHSAMNRDDEEAPDQYVRIVGKHDGLEKLTATIEELVAKPE